MNVYRTATPMIASLALAVAATLFAVPEAEAAITRVNYVHATGVCQPATPLELGGLRFRPLGIYNNKTTSIFISCTFDTELVSDQDLTDMYIWFDNQGTTQQTVTCTAVGGRRGLGSSAVAEAIILPVNTEASLEFENLNRVSTSFSAFGLSCELPPKVEMGLIRFLEEDASDGL